MVGGSAPAARVAFKTAGRVPPERLVQAGVEVLAREPDVGDQVIVKVGHARERAAVPDGAEAAWLARRFGSQRFSFRSNSQTTQAAAARAGYGVALLPHYIVLGHEPDLVPVLPGERLPQRDVWLVIRRDVRNVPRMRAVADYLVDLFRRERRLLEGR